MSQELDYAMNFRIVNFIQNSQFYAGKTSELKKFWRPFVGDRVNLFQCHQLCWILEVKKNIERLVFNLIDVILMYF